jgi:hypothetical protein
MSVIYPRPGNKATVYVGNYSEPFNIFHKVALMRLLTNPSCTLHLSRLESSKKCSFLATGRQMEVPVDSALWNSSMPRMPSQL